MSKGKFAAGAIIGAAAGFFAGILSAPKSGEKTRKDIKAQAGDVKAETMEKIEQYSDEFNNVANSTKHKATQVYDDVKTTAEDLKERTENAVAGAKKGFFEKEDKE